MYKISNKKIYIKLMKFPIIVQYETIAFVEYIGTLIVSKTIEVRMQTVKG